jgi:hypothetical protein
MEELLREFDGRDRLAQTAENDLILQHHTVIQPILQAISRAEKKSQLKNNKSQTNPKTQ